MDRRNREYAPSPGHAGGGGAAVAHGPGKHTQVERCDAPASAAPVAQRKAAAAAGGTGVAGEAASGAGASLPADGGGAAMAKDVQSKMEKIFGTSLSVVRIYQGPRAAALGAKAYTQGTDIHFAPGEYHPGAPDGDSVLGHELAHVIQQSTGRVTATSSMHGVPVNEDAGLEAEADEMGAKAARGEPVFAAGKGPVVHSMGDGAPIQRIQVPGPYRLTESANLRQRAEPYTAIMELPEDSIVTVPVGAEELAFRLNILSRNHTYVSYQVPRGALRHGWVKDSVLQRHERGVASMHFDAEIGEARERGQQAGTRKDRAGVQREGALIRNLSDVMKPRITAWIPTHIDTSNLYAFVVALNHNILNDAQFRVTYTRTYNHPERCVNALAGDCRSICELLQYITRDVLGVAGVEIESVKDGVRVAGSNLAADMYTNHHWVKIGGQRFDAMEDAAFSFGRWQVHRNRAWRAMVAGDIIQGISVNEL